MQPMVPSNRRTRGPLKLHQWRDAVFLLILALGIVERLSRLANLVSIERDWVPTMVAAGATDKQHPPYDLSRLNAVMSRVDLICRLGSPNSNFGLHVYH